MQGNFKAQKEIDSSSIGSISTDGVGHSTEDTSELLYDLVNNRMDWGLNGKLLKSIWWKVNIFENLVFQMRYNIFQELIFRLVKFGGTTLTYFAFVSPPGSGE